jgi:hypothetical protein
MVMSTIVGFLFGMIFWREDAQDEGKNTGHGLPKVQETLFRG